MHKNEIIWKFGERANQAILIGKGEVYLTTTIHHTIVIKEGLGL